MGARMLILSPTDDRGGAEEYMLTVANAAVERGWEVTVSFELTLRTRSIAQELEDQDRAAYIDARVLGSHRRAVIRQAFATARLLARVRPDVTMIVLPWPTAGVGCMLATALASAPTVVVFQLAPWAVPIGRWGPPCRWAHRRRQQWITVSDQNRDAVAASFGLAQDAIRTIYNGAAEAARLSGDDLAAARLALRAALQLRADARVVITVARLETQKGHADLLEVLPSVLRGRSNTFFVWVGDGELRAELESAVRRDGLQEHVRILGYRADVSSLLHGSDLFVLPSRSEGHPFALAEALAHGLPVVSSDAGGGPEMVRDGTDGLIHRRGDPADLARQLSWAFDHPAEMLEMAVSGRSRAEAFSESKMLRETFAALETLSRGRRLTMFRRSVT